MYKQIYTMFRVIIYKLTNIHFFLEWVSISVSLVRHTCSRCKSSKMCNFLQRYTDKAESKDLAQSL